MEGGAAEEEEGGEAAGAAGGTAARLCRGLPLWYVGTRRVRQT